MDCGCDFRREVFVRKHEVLVRDEARATKGKGHWEVAGQILPRKDLQSRLSITGFAGDVAVIAVDEVRDIVNTALDSDVGVCRSCVRRDLLQVPSFVVVGAKKATKEDNVEDDDRVEKEDKHEYCELLAPRQSNIWPFHPPHLSQTEAGNPEGTSHDRPQPNPARATRGDFFDGIRCLFYDYPTVQISSCIRGWRDSLLIVF